MARTMTVDVGDELREFIDSLVKAGDYRTQSEVMRDALRLLREKQTESRLQELRDLLERVIALLQCRYLVRKQLDFFGLADRSVLVLDCRKCSQLFRERFGLCNGAGHEHLQLSMMLTILHTACSRSSANCFYLLEFFP